MRKDQLGIRPRGTVVKAMLARFLQAVKRADDKSANAKATNKNAPQRQVGPKAVGGRRERRGTARLWFA